ncbi:lytic polysaccharide monooxygenase auxiliary activity family 9 protein [Streptomyces sp. NPDC002643]
MHRTHRLSAQHVAMAAAVAALAPPLLAAPALAHGAPTDPVSRVSACSPEGGDRAGSAACRAATAANGAPFTAWDNLRVAGVNGRDRQVVPDGQLCSGGLAPYKGLDLARTDWPSTDLSPGATLKLTYRSTIPHTGTFKLFLTKPGYDPTKPLKWSDLPEKPFASVTDPPLRNGSYTFSAKLPADRSGRHVLYTIWQNTSTVDTYYSCSDVVFPTGESGNSGAGEGSSLEGRQEDEKDEGTGGAEETGQPEGAGKSREAGEAGADTDASPTPSESTGVRDESGAEIDGDPVASSGDDDGASVPLVAGGATALVLAAVTALSLRVRRRRPRIGD